MRAVAVRARAGGRALYFSSSTWVTACTIALTFPPKPGPPEVLVFGRIKEEQGHESQGSYDGTDRRKCAANRAAPISAALRGFLDSYRPRLSRGGWCFPCATGSIRQPFQTPRAGQILSLFLKPSTPAR
jgi:hypothetical protein